MFCRRDFTALTHMFERSPFKSVIQAPNLSPPKFSNEN